MKRGRRTLDDDERNDNDEIIEVQEARSNLVRDRVSSVSSAMSPTPPITSSLTSSI